MREMTALRKGFFECILCTAELLLLIVTDLRSSTRFSPFYHYTAYIPWKHLDASMRKKLIPWWLKSGVLLSQSRQYLRCAIGNRDGMLKLSRTLAISRADRPAIRFHARFRSSGINHRLDSKHRPRAKLERRPFLRKM